MGKIIIASPSPQEKKKALYLCISKSYVQTLHENAQEGLKSLAAF